MFRTNLRGHDLYYGTPLQQERMSFSSSYHDSGKTYLHTPVGQRPGKSTTPLAQFAGKRELGTSSGDLRLLRWDYKPKPDTSTRRTLVLDVTKLPRPLRSWTVALWGVEHGREDLVDEIVSGGVYGNMPVLGHLHADWTEPELVVVLWTLSPAAWTALERSRSEGEQ